MADADPAIRAQAVKIIAANGFDQPQNLTKVLLAESDQQTKSVQEAIARFEDSSRLWTASLVNAPRSGNVVTAPGAFRLDYTVNLIRA